MACKTGLKLSYKLLFLAGYRSLIKNKTQTPLFVFLIILAICVLFFLTLFLFFSDWALVVLLSLARWLDISLFLNETRFDFSRFLDRLWSRRSEAYLEQRLVIEPTVAYWLSFIN